MFSENVDYVLLYRDHRTVAKAPTHNKKKAGQTVNVVRGFFNKSWGSMPQTPLPALGTYRTRIHAFCESKHSH